MTMYNGQIFALLGHNGAGKTTTLSMLTGLIQADEGIAEVFGINIFNNMQELRKNLGVCPQHDVLFDFLTPNDHLRLFASFKGAEPEKIESQVIQMLEDIDLTSVKNQIVKNLSGGQKRKLSVAIAMIGDSKIVMLDEPTSGMDISSRRKLWQMLKKNKNGKIIILTTHYMDEADILGDRIAIMAEGEVQCTGSSLFLKNRYGVGYNLIISKQNRQLAPQIDSFIQKRINQAKKVQEVSSEISYQLPSSSQNQFKEFFCELDQNLSILGIRSYGVGITTLEEVFLKIGHLEEEIKQEKFDKNAYSKQEFNFSLQDSEQIDSKDQDLDEYSISNDPIKDHFYLHTYVIIKKKILMQIRDKKTLGIDIIFPIILIFAGLALSTFSIIREGSSKEMTPFMFPLNISVIQNDKSKFHNNIQIQKFINQSYIGLQDSKKFKQEGIAKISNTSNSNFFQQLSEYDDYIYNQVSLSKINPSFGQVYVHSLNKPQQNCYRIALLLNSTQRNSVGAFGGYANTAILKQYLIDNQLINSSDTLNIKFTFQPFPLTKKFKLINKAASGIASAILMIIAWMMISDSLIQSIIHERQKNIKHQIMISGSSISAYWMGNYIADIILQSVPAFIGILGVYTFGLEVTNVEYLFIITIFANPVFVYFFSFLFENEEQGSLSIKVVYFLFGIIAPISISILQIFDKDTKEVADLLKWFCLPFPAFSLSSGYISIANRNIISLALRLSDTLNPYDTNVSGHQLLFLILSIPFYWILIVCMEMKLFDRGTYRQRGDFSLQNQRISINNQEKIDEDVNEEILRVEQMSNNQLPIRVNKMRKTFNNVVAINQVSFGLEFGECFALLGVSGAGKSTCFKCLTGEIYPQLGDITINGFDVTTASGFEKARKQIGYCPQFDAIFQGLTVLEHLQTYACLKGIPYNLRTRIIEKQLKDMDLQYYRNIRANNLSGGNKRKLSVAIAMIGNPPLVFLDEPSTGVDPQAKRFMWNIVSKISTLRKKSAVIITTHSMEEAEALCTKIGILVNGEFKCLGSSQYIKDKYGIGFEIEIKIRTLSEEEIKEILKYSNSSQLDLNDCKKILQQQNNTWLIDQLNENGIGQNFYFQYQKGILIDAEEFIRWQFAETYGQKVCNFLEKKFKNFELIEHYGNSYKIKVSRDNYSIGFLFGMMEEIINHYNITEYSVTQTTLEQIFNNFAIQAEHKEGREQYRNKSRKKLIQNQEQDQINYLQEGIFQSKYNQ